jgi:hypothetical protein
MSAQWKKTQQESYQCHAKEMAKLETKIQQYSAEPTNLKSSQATEAASAHSAHLAHAAETASVQKEFDLLNLALKSIGIQFTAYKRKSVSKLKKIKASNEESRGRGQPNHDQGARADKVRCGDQGEE